MLTNISWGLLIRKRKEKQNDLYERHTNSIKIKFPNFRSFTNKEDHELEIKEKNVNKEN